jgi:hypothetical protein
MRQIAQLRVSTVVQVEYRESTLYSVPATKYFIFIVVSSCGTYIMNSARYGKSL